MPLPFILRPLVLGAAALLGGCAGPLLPPSHALDTPVHVVSSAPSTCPVCALYSVHRSNVVLISTGEGLGAGVVVSAGGDILTSAHVVKDHPKVGVKTYDDRTYRGEVVLADEEADLAIVRLHSPGESWPAVELDTDENLPIGSKVYVIGHPVGLGWTVSQGIVSGRRRAGEAAPTALIQTDVAISPGNSGGPLLDEHGHLIGIVRSKLVGPGIENVSFAVPIADVSAFLARVPAAPAQSETAAAPTPTAATQPATTPSPK